MYRRKESLGQGCLFDLKFVETPVANLRPIVTLSKAGFYADTQCSRGR